jgi:hypothetical protein
VISLTVGLYESLLTMIETMSVMSVRTTDLMSSPVFSRNQEDERWGYFTVTRMQGMSACPNPRVDLSTATFALSALECDAVETVVSGSQQTHVQLLPNHHMNEELELSVQNVVSEEQLGDRCSSFRIFQTHRSV